MPSGMYCTDSDIGNIFLAQTGRCCRIRQQYFPGPDWEVLPNSADLRISVHTLQHPSYLSRAIWYGGGLWDYNNRAYADWVARNRMNPGIVLNTGHAYGAIIRANQAEFDKHPEYLALVNGQRVKVGNFCTSNAGLRKLVVNHALKYFKDNPNADSISMEPTDGN